MSEVSTRFPKWKHLVVGNPTIEDLKVSWKIVFKYYPHECRIEGLTTGRNTGFVIKTPTGIHCHGGFGNHTEEPLLFEESIFYEGCGCTWGTDAMGERYYKIDKSTMLPKDWDEVQAIEVIRRFMTNKINSLPKLFISID